MLVQHNFQVTFDLSPAVLARLDKLIGVLGGLSADDVSALLERLQQHDANLRKIAVDPNLSKGA